MAEVGKYKGFAVTLSRDIDHTEAARIAALILCINGVVDVNPITEKIDDEINRRRIANLIIDGINNGMF